MNKPKATASRWLADINDNGADTIEFREGKSAHAGRAPYSSCPYSHGLRRLRWQDGWLSANDDAVGVEPEGEQHDGRN